MLRRLSPVVIAELRTPETTEVLALPSLCDVVYFLGRQLESRNVPHIGLQPQLVRAGRDCDNSLVQAPPEGNLTLRDTILPRQYLVDGLHRATRSLGNGSQGRVSLNCYLILTAEVDKVSVLQIWVILDYGEDVALAESDTCK